MANLKDVAKLAGVSTATVSRVINGSEKVSSDTKRKILKAIKTLDFKPSRVAQRLRYKDGKRKLIGLIVPDIQNPFYVDVVRGVEDVTYANNFAILICNFAQNAEREKLYIELMQIESVDGLIVAPVDENDPKVINLIKSGLPVVCIDRGITSEPVDIVVVDNEQGAFNAVDYLISKGHKRIAHIAGLPNIPTSIQRLNGYKAALKKARIKFDENLVRFGDSKHVSGKNFTEELLNIPEPPTAFFTGNNLITLGALETIHSRGLKIPEEIAIIGFDDMPWSISLNPPLTAVSQPGYDIGRSSAEMLFQRIYDPNRSTVKLELKTKLIKRNSC